MDIHNELKKAAREGFVRAVELRRIAASAGIDPASAERAALEAGIVPERYRRNGATISIEQQLKLLDSTAAVIGCGGLGGYVVEELARLGVGRITAIALVWADGRVQAGTWKPVPSRPASTIRNGLCSSLS